MKAYFRPLTDKYNQYTVELGPWIIHTSNEAKWRELQNYIAREDLHTISPALNRILALGPFTVVAGA